MNTSSLLHLQPYRDVPSRRLILHADDFGMSQATNAGIIEGFLHGLLTSTSVLANGPACDDALSQWKQMQARLRCELAPSAPGRRLLRDPGTPFDLGVHLNLTQGRPLTGRAFPARLLGRDGNFPGVFALAPRLIGLQKATRRALFDELCAQVEKVLEQGVVPTHLNGHQYVELLPAVARLVPELLARYRMRIVRVAWEQGLTGTTLVAGRAPAQWGLAQVKRAFALPFLLRMRRAGALTPTAYCGTAHAGKIDLALVARFLRHARGNLVEIGLHPGCATRSDEAENAGAWHDPLASGRPRELEMLTSPELIKLLARSDVRLGRLNTAAPSLAKDAAA